MLSSFSASFIIFTHLLRSTRIHSMHNVRYNAKPLDKIYSTGKCRLVLWLVWCYYLDRTFSNPGYIKDSFYFHFTMAVMPCNSDICKVESKRFFDIINMEVDPCEDFSKFVCGKFYEDDSYPENHMLAWESAQKTRKLCYLLSISITFK